MHDEHIHSHEDEHEHHHSLLEHHHSHAITSLNRAFYIGISLNIAFVLVEFIFGVYANSMGLLSDAGHNLSDVASLILALLAFKLTKVNANKNFTYGYKKSTVLVSLLNAVILMVAVVIIVVESVKKFITPENTDGNIIAMVAAIGVIINALTAWLFMKDKDKDLNVKGAYLHMAMDALVSVGVVISGLVIHFTGWNIIDPIIGLLIAVIIVFSTWELLGDSLKLALDGVPEDIDFEKVKNEMLKNPEVKDVHHMHIWAMSTTENALTAHVVISDILKMQAVKCELKERLANLGISHATLEFEPTNCHCHDLGQIH